VCVCVCVGFVMCGCVGFVMCGCVYVRGCNVWICVCVGFGMRGCVYVWAFKFVDVRVCVCVRVL